MKIGQIHIIFQDDSEFNVSELTEFISLLNAIVEVLEQRFFELPESESDIFNDLEKEKASRILNSLTPIEWNDYVKASKDSNFGISSISKNSPLEITICGCLVLVTLALVFSGGELTCTLKEGFKAKLPSLGEGLKTLREAVSIGKHIEISFGVQRVTIKLNKTEMDLLMQQDPSTESRGGFQKYLIGLQYRANKSTREIVLDQQDIEKIKRLKNNPSKGGFQSRFNKIFGRHI
jgi:hypothetical protein